MCVVLYCFVVCRKMRLKGGLERKLMLFLCMNCTLYCCRNEKFADSSGILTSPGLLL